jgi:cysteinyl-tRNA synthetase
MLNLYNTLTKKKEIFEPLKERHVGLYTCGPTVYNYAHIGNLRTYVFEDILKRVLKHNHYDINHVMNITDVGHLTDDADAGEDKMEAGAKREGKTAWDIAEFYSTAFKQDMEDLNLLEPNTWCKATDHIKEQIDLVQKLIDKSFTYETSDGIYFDTTKINDYGEIANLQNQELKEGARVEMGEKKNPHDFALWKFSKEGETRQMEWEAFGKMGFPGWHLECSAMSMKYLGEQFDIHCGGIDHVPIHHTNEIAQSEAITDKKPWVKYWLHGEFLVLGKDEKMAKSSENFITIQTLKDKGISPLAYRYFLLQTHYRKQLSFSWEALEAAQTGLNNLKKLVKNIPENTAIDPLIREQFDNAVNDDLNTPEALAIIWTGLKNKTINLEMIIDFDKVLGLDLHNPEEKEIEIPDEVQTLLDERAKAREEKNFAKSDELRDEISKLGYEVEDTDEGQRITKHKT